MCFLCVLFSAGGIYGKEGGFSTFSDGMACPD